MARNQAILSDSQPWGDGIMVAMHGEIDFSRSPDLRVELLALLNTKPRKLVLDLADVPYMDSSGVATLVEALTVQRKTGNKLVLCNLQPKVRGIFEIARLNMVFQIVENLEAAKTA
jgi:anti-sigma B factor antagonist